MEITRGILLLEPGAPRPSGFDDDALTECADPYRAFADLVILGHAERRRAAWGLDGAHRLRLVVAPVRSDAFDRLATRLVESVRRATPAVAITDLRPNASAPAEPGLAPAPPVRSSAPIAREPEAPNDSDPDLSDPERLTADEIAMLLDDEETGR